MRARPVALVFGAVPEPPMIHRLAETPTLFETLAPNEERIACEDCLVHFAPGSDARSCTVQGLRAEPEGFAATVARVRDLMRSRGRLQATWEILSSIHPPSAVDRLLALGLARSTPPFAVVMTLSTEPPRSDPGIVVTAVETIADFKTHVAITHEVFGALDQLPAELERIDEDGARKLADRSFVRYIAWIDGAPAGAATATFTAAGVMLHSGSTLAPFRRRGVYTAMVTHRWHDAAARGTPHLITRAGPMSRPILANLGFHELGEVHFLVDSLARPGAE